MKVKFFAQLRTVTGLDECDLAVREPLNAEQLWKLLDSKFPGLSRWQAATRIARNMTYVDEGTHLHDGDEIALIPPVSGG